MMKYLLSTLLLFIIYPTLMAYEGKEIKDESFFKDIISKALVCESSHQETLVFFECYTTELKKNIETLLKEQSTKTDDLFNANVFLLEEANSCFVVSQAIEQKIENSTKRKKTLLALEKSLFFAWRRV